MSVPVFYLDMVASGPREPGVGAELTSPEDSLNYDNGLDKVSISRVNSIASSSDPDGEDRNKDFDVSLREIFSFGYANIFSHFGLQTHRKLFGTKRSNFFEIK